MKEGFLGALVLGLIYCSVGLRLNDAFSAKVKATTPKYAYVTMVFNSKLLSDTEWHQLKDPSYNGWRTSPFCRFTSSDYRCMGPYEDVTLYRHNEDSTDGRLNLNRRMLPAWEHAGQKYEAAEKLAEQLQKAGSEYPILVLTNHVDKVREGVSQKHPNLIPIDMSDFLKGRRCGASVGYEATLQKILIWQLYDYQKVIWIDSDVDVMSNPDYVFETGLAGGVVGMRNDAFCDYTDDYGVPGKIRNRTVSRMSAAAHHEFMYRNTTNHDFASSIMMGEPNREDFEAMLALSRTLRYCGTDQDLIAEHFWRKSQTKDHELVQFFPSETALWGRCAMTKLQKNKQYTPTFVHKRNSVSWAVGIR